MFRGVLTKPIIQVISAIAFVVLGLKVSDEQKQSIADVFSTGKLKKQVYLLSILV